MNNQCTALFTVIYRISSYKFTIITGSYSASMAVISASTSIP